MEKEEQDMRKHYFIESKRKLAQIKKQDKIQKTEKAAKFEEERIISAHKKMLESSISGCPIMPRGF